MSIVSKPMVDVTFLKLEGLVRGLWESAYIFNKNWKEKKDYAAKILREAIQSVDEINKDSHRYMWVKEMEHFYNPEMSFKDLKKYVDMIQEKKYEEAMADLDKISVDLRRRFDEKNLRACYI